MSTELKYWYLREHKLFRNLSFSEINTLCILKRYKKSKKSEIIELPSGDVPRIYLLKKGTLKLIKIDEEGNEVLIDILQKGDLFGEFGLEQRPGSHSEFMKVMSEEAILCTFYKRDLERLMLQKPEFALSYIKFIGLNFVKLKNSYNNIFFKDAKTRLVIFLNMLIEKEDVQTAAYTLPNYLTQKDIAQLICTTRQTVITLFNELEKEGILDYSQKNIVIPDVEKIKKLAENVK